MVSCVPRIVSIWGCPRILAPAAMWSRKSLRHIDRINFSAGTYRVGEKPSEQSRPRADVRHRHSRLQVQDLGDFASLDEDFTIVRLETLDEVLDTALLKRGIDLRVDLLGMGPWTARDPVSSEFAPRRPPPARMNSPRRPSPPAAPIAPTSSTLHFRSIMASRPPGPSTPSS